MRCSASGSPRFKEGRAKRDRERLVWSERHAHGLSATVRKSIRQGNLISVSRRFDRISDEAAQWAFSRSATLDTKRGTSLSLDDSPSARIGHLVALQSGATRSRVTLTEFPVTRPQIPCSAIAFSLLGPVTGVAPVQKSTSFLRLGAVRRSARVFRAEIFLKTGKLSG